MSLSDASPMHMARDLVARHSDIGFIRGYIINFFGRAPTREKIEALREEHLATSARQAERRLAPMSDGKRIERERRRRLERDAAERYRKRGAA